MYIDQQPLHSTSIPTYLHSERLTSKYYFLDIYGTEIRLYYIVLYHIKGGHPNSTVSSVLCRQFGVPISLLKAHTDQVQGWRTHAVLKSPWLSVIIIYPDYYPLSGLD